MADLRTVIRVELRTAIRKAVRLLQRDLRDLGKSGAAAGAATARGAKTARAGLVSISEQLQKLQYFGAAVFGGSLLASWARSLGRVADTYTEIGNRIRLVSDGQQEALTIQRELFEVAQRSRGAYDATATIFARLALASEATGVTTRELTTVVETLNKAVLVGGSSLTEARAGLIQFAQGIASGRLQGDELRSVLENLLGVSRALVTGINEVGDVGRVTVGDLRELAQQGKLTPDLLLRALVAAADDVEQEFDGLELTIGQAAQKFKNAFGKEVAGTINDTLSLSGALSRGLSVAADNFDALAKAATAAGTVFAVSVVPALLSGMDRLVAGTKKVRLGFVGIASAIAAVAAPGVDAIFNALTRHLDERDAAAFADVDNVKLIQSNHARIKEIEALLSGGREVAPKVFRPVSSRERAKLEAERTELEALNLRTIRRKRGSVGSVPGAAGKLPAFSGAASFDVPAITTGELADRARAVSKNLEKQIALYDETGQAASLRYELERGALAGLRGPLRETLERNLSILEAVEANKEAQARNKEEQEAAAQAAKQAGEIQTEIDQRRAEAMATYQQAQLSLRDELAALQGPLAQATLAADRWRESMLAAVVDGAAGAEQFRAQVETAYQQMLAEAREVESQRLAEAADKALLESDRAIDGLHAGLAEYATQAQTAAQQVQGAFETAWQGAENSLADALASGEVRLSSFADAAKRYLSQALSHQLLNQAANFGLGFFGIGNAGGAGAFAGRGAGVNAANAVPGLAGVAHSGGLAGQLGRMRQVGLPAFVEAARYHRGGIVSPFKPGEVPAVLRAGEEVLHENDPRHRRNLGEPSVTVNVNNAGTPQRVTDQQARFDGRRWVIDIFVEDVNKNGRGIQSIQHALGRGRKDF